MAKTLPISEVKTRLPELITGVDERDDEVIVTNGRPAAIIVNIREYESLKETLDVLSDPEMMKQIRKSEAFYTAGKKGLTIEEVFGELPAGPRKRKRG